MSRFSPSRSLVIALLEATIRSETACEWQFQGFGMFRLYLSKEVRLHVWVPGMAVPNVSTIHTHPWNFTSEVVVGEVLDVRYYEHDGDGPPTHASRTIVCGHGGGLTSDPTQLVALRERSSIIYGAGQRYQHRNFSIHESRATPGSVTIIRREFLSDTEHARVFYPAGTEWVAAEPRDATREEVVAMAKLALDFARNEDQ